MKPILSADLIRAVATEAGNRSMRYAGREVWIAADHRAACRESARLHRYVEETSNEPINERKLTVRKNDPKMVDIEFTEEQKKARRQTATPGDWEVCQMTQADGSKFVAIKGANEIGVAVCLVAGLDFADQEDAYNAYLIAAAPSLLAALEELVNSPSSNAARDRARVAIAKTIPN